MKHNLLYFELPEYVIKCLKILKQNGFKAYCVGGAVRDIIMDRIVNDYDIATDATPQQTIDIFEKTVPTGIKHGTITVIIDGNSIEITTFRSDFNYINHRSPSGVNFVKNIDDDLSRRDFTINSICYDYESGVYDPFNGITDIEKKTIRTVGLPDKRFNEDALRIMRCFRFSSQLGFSINEQTLNSALNFSYLLKEISVERVYIELFKALSSDFPNAFLPLVKCGALNYLGINGYTGEIELNTVTKNPFLRFAVLLLKTNSDCKITLDNLKTDNKSKKQILDFYCLLKTLPTDNRNELKYLLRNYSCDTIEIWLKHLNFVSGLNELKKIIKANEPYTLKMLNISGNDLMNLGFKGKEISEKLEFLLNQVIIKPELNTKENLLKLLVN